MMQSRKEAKIRRLRNGLNIAYFLLFYLVLIVMASDMLLDQHSPLSSSLVKRKLSLYLPESNTCVWTPPQNVESNTQIYGTLFAAYPGSGIRKTWQQVGAMTGIRTLDDFFDLGKEKIGLVKTQYPHYEGIWSYGSSLDQVVLLIRSPLWAMPSYHTILSEIEYAHTWEEAYKHLDQVFTHRAPLDDWIKWRDYRFNDEIELWGDYIDFYMSNGIKYWFDYDFERNGQYPFRYANTTERYEQDAHCILDVETCVPKAVVSYENLIDPLTGPAELNKIADVLRGKPGMTVLDPDGVSCIYHQTWLNAPEPNNDSRDDCPGCNPREDYKFTSAQLTKMADKLNQMIVKYSTWSGQQASDLVENFQSYLVEVLAAIPGPNPAPAPSGDYAKDLVDWYSSKGKGDRNSKAKLQSMSLWDEVSQFYDDDTTQGTRRTSEIEEERSILDFYDEFGRAIESARSYFDFE